MNPTESIFAKCECGCCSLLEIHVDDFDGEGQLQFEFVSWVSPRGERPLSKKERIRWCKHVMKTGNPWADHTIVSKEDALRIAKFIIKKSEQPKQNGKTIRK